jgi:hypothetical protein
MRCLFGLLPAAMPLAASAEDTRLRELQGMLGPTMHCSSNPDLWQVDVGDPNTGVVDVGDRPWPGCTEEDPEADEYRMLFPGQAWR